MTQMRRYGVLLPHFGRYASRQRLIGGARLIEELGFDSVWVRDHVVYQPYGFEDPDRTHLDTFVVLGAIAAVTERVVLGTGALMPHRHPIHLANAIASLDRMAGPGRLLVGMGLGAWQHEFDALGMGDMDRKELFAEQIGILRALWTGKPVDHEGRYYRFKGVELHPEPVGNVPIWACGATLSAARRAAELCDGWLPRMPIRDLRARVVKMRQLAAEAGRAAPDVGALPFIVPARTTDEALSRIPERFLGSLYIEANKRWTKPASGAFGSPDDLDGTLVYGDPERVVAGIERLHDAGASHVVFDLRLQPEEFDDVLRLIGERVLPELRRL
ncbi:MAG TPA: TIGR03619 family F420-dependent LLM class oxidoreductase [Candidatus Limnocylindria bacterium]|nr:TIGR03619 family F420-dependent LLM class oxidoreductase [Candidatus Limnocylindria bacterium]